MPVGISCCSMQGATLSDRRPTTHPILHPPCRIRQALLILTGSRLSDYGYSSTVFGARTEQHSPFGQPNSTMPGSWSIFCHCQNNKTEHSMAPCHVPTIIRTSSHNPTNASRAKHALVNSGVNHLQPSGGHDAGHPPPSFARRHRNQRAAPDETAIMLHSRL